MSNETSNLPANDFPDIEERKLTPPQLRPQQPVPPPSQPPSEEVKQERKSPRSFNLNDTGYYLDGWADLIEGRGDKAEAIRKQVYQQLRSRQITNFSVSVNKGYSTRFSIIGRLYAAMSDNYRDYIVLKTRDELDLTAIITIYIASQAKDLYASWRTSISLGTNWTLVIILAGIAAAVAFCGGIIGAIPALLLTAISNSLTPIFGQQTLNQFGYTQPQAQALTAFNPATFAFCFSIVFVLILLLLSLPIAAAGYLRKGNIWYYFLVEPSWLDIEDISAMSLITHKTILKAVENAGVDTNLLRPKTEFKTGRRNDLN